MSKAYKTIPDGAKSVFLTNDGCGDDCHCSWFQIRAVLDDKHPMTPHYQKGQGDWSHKLWESSWFWACDMDDDTDYVALYKEIQDACQHYAILLKPADSVWDWDKGAERIISTTKEQ